MFGKFFIGGHVNPYLIRWFLIPRNKWLNLYLHKFCRDDDDRALHDHPWWFVSVMIRGSYKEHTENGCVIRHSPSIAFRRATHRHKVELFTDSNGNKIPCWTIVITGPRSRVWGFWCPKGFVPWTQFVGSQDNGNIGKGCGE